MTLDVQNANKVAGGEIYTPPPIQIEGITVEPALITPCSQVTGDAATVLRARLRAGRVKVFGKTIDVLPSENALVTTTTDYRQYVGGVAVRQFTAGMAVWFTAVAVQHRVSGAIGVVWVPGLIAAVANAIYLTATEIAAALDDQDVLAILGDVRFHRSADTVVRVQVTDVRRPSYVDSAEKTGVVADQAAQTSLTPEFRGFLELPIDYTQGTAVGAGNNYYNDLPGYNFPFGGYLDVDNSRFVNELAGVGVGASLTLKVWLGNAEVTGVTWVLPVATSGVPATVAPTGAASGGTNRFDQNEVIDIEIDAAAAAYTAGRGTLRIPVYEYVRH